MKTLLIVGSGLIGGALMFQMPATPPMRMGLWESTATSKMTGVNVPQGGAMPNSTFKIRACMTPENYAKNFGASQRQKDCMLSNEVWTVKRYSWDMTCKSSNVTGHFEGTFDSKESTHSVMHMSMNPGGNRPMQMEMTVQAHFVSADCGKITPDNPEIIR